AATRDTRDLEASIDDRPGIHAATIAHSHDRRDELRRAHVGRSAWGRMSSAVIDRPRTIRGRGAGRVVPTWGSEHDSELEHRRAREPARAVIGSLDLRE